jgi:hypothetical protein
MIRSPTAQKNQSGSTTINRGRESSEYFPKHSLVQVIALASSAVKEVAPADWGEKA